jgi:hypothetical protein
MFSVSLKADQFIVDERKIAYTEYPTTNERDAALW